MSEIEWFVIVYFSFVFLVLGVLIRRMPLPASQPPRDPAEQAKSDAAWDAFFTALLEGVVQGLDYLPGGGNGGGGRVRRGRTRFPGPFDV